jgi:hypothetical protein
MQQPARPAPPQEATQEKKRVTNSNRNISAQPSARLAATLDKTGGCVLLCRTAAPRSPAAPPRDAPGAQRTALEPVGARRAREVTDGGRGDGGSLCTDRLTGSHSSCHTGRRSDEADAPRAPDTQTAPGSFTLRSVCRVRVGLPCQNVNKERRLYCVWCVNFGAATHRHVTQSTTLLHVCAKRLRPGLVVFQTLCRLGFLNRRLGISSQMLVGVSQTSVANLYTPVATSQTRVVVFQNPACCLFHCTTAWSTCINMRRVHK